MARAIAQSGYTPSVGGEGKQKRSAAPNKRPKDRGKFHNDSISEMRTKGILIRTKRQAGFVVLVCQENQLCLIVNELNLQIRSFDCIAEFMTLRY